MNHVPLFAGINGFGIAAEWMGWQQPFHCEIDKFCQRVIQYYWPNSIPYYDIKETDFRKHRGTVDILTGGFPCQPFSASGKRKGTEDDRHLWPEMLRAIREIQPRWIVGENVRGLTNWNGGLVFDEVQSDLENEEYEVLPFLLPACAVNAPHRRDRIWFIAYSNLFRNNRNNRTKENNMAGEKPSNTQQKRNKRTSEIGRFTDEWITTDPDKERFQCKRKSTGMGRDQRFSFGNSQKNKSTWENFPTVSPVCNGNDVFPGELDGITFPKWRNESIKAGGNAVVPALVYEIFKAIEAYEIQFSK